MNKDLIINILICIIIIVLLIVYSIYVLVDERKKIKYYNKIIGYDTAWDKYQTMVDKQRIIIIKKRVHLCILKFLVMIRRMFK